jgi:hypothetical protein
MTQTEALRLALEALEGVLDDSPKVMEASISGGLYEVVQCRDAITAIKAALEAKDEPVAYINVEQRKLEWAKYVSWGTPTVVNLPKIPLYTTPPQRTWVGLTDEEIKAFDTWHDNREEEIGWVNPSEIVAYIEAKLKEKNGL